MTGRSKTPALDDLQAYVDGALDEGARAAIEAYLAENPARAAEVESWRRQKRTLGALYDHVAEEEVPERLVAALRRQPAQGGMPGWRSLAAMLALFILGAGLGWFGRGGAIGDSRAMADLVMAAAQAHVVYAGEVRHPVEVRAAESDHLQAWLSKRLDRPLVIPDLRKVGLSLVGGRLLPGARGAAAQLMYEDESGRRLTLYVVPTGEGEDQAYRYTELDGLEALTWEDERLSCALVAAMPRDRLRLVADEAYRQLS